MWSFTSLINFYECWRGIWITKFMRDFAKGKITTAFFSCALVCAGLFSEGCRYLSYVLRTTPGMYGDPTFEVLVIFAPISSVLITEGYLTLGLAWLDIAVKSSAKGGFNQNYKRRKLAVRSAMLSVVLVCFYFFAIGR